MQRVEIKYLVSVIVPVYNVEQYIGRCIESIQRQTYSNLEILLVNDGSKDGSGIICEKYKKLDRRIKIINKINGGLSDARNAGIREAKGEYLVFIDGDDYIKQDYVEKLLYKIVSIDADVVLCSFELVDDNGKLLKQEILSELPNEVVGHDILDAVLTSYGYKYVVAWNKIYRKEIFNKLRFDKDKIYEDEFINFRLFWNCGKIGILEETLYCYVQRNGSIVQSAMTREKIMTKNEMHITRIEFYNEKQDKELYIKACQLYCNWLVECIGRYSYILEREDKEKFQKDMKLYAVEASENKNIDIKVRLQNKIGFYSLKLASLLKIIYKRG